MKPKFNSKIESIINLSKTQWFWQHHNGLTSLSQNCIKITLLMTSLKMVFSNTQSSKNSSILYPYRAVNKASSQPKPPASQPSLASYFRLILPVLLMKNLTVIKIPSKKLVKHPFPSFEWNWTHILTGLEVWIDSTFGICSKVRPNIMEHLGRF